MSNKRRVVLLLILSCIAVSPAFAQNDTSKDPFFEAVHKRNAAAEVVDLTFDLKEWYPSGFGHFDAVHPNIRKDLREERQKERALESTSNRLVIQGSMVRYENHHQVWNHPKAQV